MSQTNSKQHEYSYLINLYTDLVGLPVITSTFNYLSKEDKELLDEHAKDLSDIMGRIIPKLADKEL